MDNKEMMGMMGKMMGDDEMAAVVGGQGDKWVEGDQLNGLHRKSAWGTVCEKYECGMGCNGKGTSLDNHSESCPLRHWHDSNATAARLNGCWSCKHSKYGKGYPSNENDVWCPYK